MDVRKVVVTPVDAHSVALATEALLNGEAVVIPTDTVYGLVVRADDSQATARLFVLKDRPGDVSIQVLVADTASARALAAEFSPVAEEIAERFWPGGVTLVLRRAAHLDWELGEDRRSIGIRCPDHPVAQKLCKTIGPLAATSANRHGEPTPTTAAGIAEMFRVGLGGVENGIALVLDGGTCGGEASTVVDLTGEEPRCLRNGRVAWGDIVEALYRRNSPGR